MIALLACSGLLALHPAASPRSGRLRLPHLSLYIEPRAERGTRSKDVSSGQPPLPRQMFIGSWFEQLPGGWGRRVTPDHREGPS